MSTNINKVNQEFFLSRSQYQARYNAGTLVVGAIYHITDEDFVSTDNIEDTVTSSSADKVLSAKQGKILNDRINNLEALGRFLSLWNCKTGLPKTNPSTLPYTYKTGDYYRINVVDETTNYMPNGTSYDGTASTTEYTGSETIEVGDVWFYDGTSWSLMTQKVGGFVEDVEVNGSSVVSGGVASIPIAGTGGRQTKGVTTIEDEVAGGLKYAYPGYIAISSPSASQISGRTTNNGMAITCKTLDYGIRYGLGEYNSTLGGAWTDTQKSTARTTIGAASPTILEFLDENDV